MGNPVALHYLLSSDIEDRAKQRRDRGRERERETEETRVNGRACSFPGGHDLLAQQGRMRIALVSGIPACLQAGGILGDRIPRVPEIMVFKLPLEKCRGTGGVLRLLCRRLRCSGALGFLGGNFGPEKKKKLAPPPPPQISRKHPPGPSSPCPDPPGRPPPPPGAFNKKSTPPSPPPSRKKKNETSTKLFCCN